MSIDPKAQTNASYVYEGCYRARGALTFAERSAWGLHASNMRLARLTQPLHPSFPSGRPATMSVRSRPTLSVPARHRALPRGDSHERRRFRLVSVTSAGRRRSWARRLRPPRVQAGDVKPAWHLRIAAEGMEAVCMLVRGRVYAATFAQRPRSQP